jgi:Cytochrome P460
MKSATICLLLALAASILAWRIASGDSVAEVAYPEGYRDWTHVKSALTSPQHADFDSLGGFHHIYANREAMTGYRTGEFAEGSVIVFDWLRMEEQEGTFIEGPRRQTDVMVRDAKRFAATGGWGFQRFVGDSKTERALTPSSDQCFACHDRLKKNALVLSSYRP